MLHVAQTFIFALQSRVLHQDAPGSTFVVTRRWLDVDAPEEQSRFYDLRDEKPLFGRTKVGPCLESELILVTDFMVEEEE